jgi:hypothetical protein
MFLLLGWMVKGLTLFWFFAGQGLADARITPRIVYILPIPTVLLITLVLLTSALVSIWRNGTGESFTSVIRILLGVVIGCFGGISGGVLLFTLLTRRDATVQVGSPREVEAHVETGKVLTEGQPSRSREPALRL